MGKNKDQKNEVMNAFYRMNYLYQASVVASRILPDTVLPNYYGRLMKEVSKKVVEKLHPDIKRTLCSCCSYPLFTSRIQANVKIKTFRKRRTKKKKLRKKVFYSKVDCDEVNKILPYKIQDESSKFERYCEVQNLKDCKPNKMYWDCKKCGFSRKFLLRPSYNLWSDKCDDFC